jgi:G:T-mismatch repair DNA endonuclease (very short patch repair protein)
MNKWTQLEEDFLIKYYPDITVSVTWIAEQLGRTKSQVQDKAIKRMKLPRNKSWTVELDNIVTQLFLASESLKSISSKTGRTPSAIKSRMTDLGIRRPKDFRSTWTRSEADYLIENYSSKSPKEIADYLNKKPYDISYRASATGLLKNKQLSKKWSIKDHQFLIDNYGILSMESIANQLDRTRYSVETRASNYDLTKARPTFTSIELVVKTILDNLKINYKTHQKIYTGRLNSNNQKHYYWVDFLVDNTVIEVQGNYWHCNPRLYPNGPLDKVQKDHTRRDELKQEHLLANGYKIIYIWEDECADLNLVRNKLLLV